MKSFLIPASQVQQFWPAIKFATTAVDNVSAEDRPKYLNKLIVELLNGKAQCFVRLDDNRRLMAIAVTKISTDELTEENILFVSCLYSFEGVGSSQWNEDIKLLKDFASARKCKRIIAYTASKQVLELTANMGFYERFRCISLDLEV